MSPRTDSDGTEWLTMSQAAARRGISVSTLLRYEKAGAITATRTLGGHRRFSAEEIDRLLGRGPTAGNSGDHSVSSAPSPLGDAGKQTRLDRPATSTERAS